VSRNKIFCYANFSMHFRIKFLLFIDFPSYVGKCMQLPMADFTISDSETCVFC